MIRRLVLALPLLVALYVLSIDTSGGVAVLATAAVAGALAGAALRRYRLLAAGAALLLPAYWGAVLVAGRGPDFWGALGVGIAVFLLLELGYDWVALFGRSVRFAEYASRWRHLVRSCGLGAAGAYLVALLAVNLAPRLGGVDATMLFVMAAAAAAAAAIILVSLVRLWLRRLADPPEAAGEEPSSGG
ncbi:MAG: hypothetical protein OXH96_12700 [Spirochaetaceae bacterium]|nr:hypothetical protein [Spirochaetaceae bacterium]